MFDLEQAIMNWRRNLRSNPGFEDGDVQELESHLREEIERLKAAGLTEEEALVQALGEIGEPDSIGEELYKTRTARPMSTPPWKQRAWVPSLLSNYIKTARRNLIGNRLYSVINILGLSVGITVCLFIYLFVRNELNYDRFHEYGDRIYRVVRVFYDGAQTGMTGVTAGPYKQGLESHFPSSVVMTTQLMPGDGVVSIGEDKFRESRLFWADANFFQVFSYPLLEGDPKTVLSRPYTVVLSKETAKKYFGEENAVGKSITIGGQSQYEVTGIFEIPEEENSHIEFDLIRSMETLRNAAFFSDWWSNSMHTYALLAPGVDTGQLEGQLQELVDKYLASDERVTNNSNMRLELALQPLHDIYFANHVNYDMQVKHGSKTILYMFGIIAVLIITVASVNFVNLATARSVNRAREIGVRKTLGAERLNLIWQFLGEALLLSWIAGLISFGVVYASMGRFEELIETPINVNLISGEVLAVTVLVLTLTGLLAGIYPAFYLSSIQPVKALKEKISFGTSQVLVRKGLIVFQFVISSLLIIGTLIINQQLHYIGNKSLGFQPDQLLNITINNNEIHSRLETFRMELKRIPGVQVASGVSGTPGGFFDNYGFKVEGKDETFRMSTLFTDHNFAEVLDLKMLAGRDFSPEFATDSAQAAIINKEAADWLGWTPEEALGKAIENPFRDSEPRRIIGVVENFHFKSLHEPITPLAVSMVPDRREILVKVSADNLRQTLTSIEQLWEEFSSLYPIEYFFLDKQFAQLYESDFRQRRIFTIFSVMAIFIACLGLFSLAAYNAERRSKEMGIRKVYGAGFHDLLLLFNREIIAVVLTGFLLAAPLTYLLAEQWLQGYAYRIPNGFLNYLLAGVIIVVLAVLTVSYQSLKVAAMNPVKSLRSE
jgi:putative ABC transport system permease protein